MDPSDSEAIERFVRGTLGCGCPDEVFNSIAVERMRGPDASAPYLRLLVGNRLLIYVLEAQDPGPARAAMSMLVRQGLEERDRIGLNRFRLVLAADHPTPALTATAVSLTDEIGLDDRAHLHVIAAGLVPASLR
jgi:hypothetical protein